MKDCRKCQLRKPRSDFNGSKSTSDLLQSYCRACSNGANKAWNLANPRRKSLAHRTRRYGITEEKFNEMLASQGGKCAIGDHEFQGGKICIDHDHVTRAVRGLLCSNHNTGLGLFADSEKSMTNAIGYLAKQNEAIFLQESW